MKRRREFLYALVTLTLAGCSSRPAKQDDQAAINLRRIAQAYELAADARRGRPPRNVEELRPYFKELGETGDPNLLLQSPRDGQPYVILFGATLDTDERATLLAYEKNGAEGTRYVLTLAREVKQMKDEEFAGATFAKGHKPPKGG